MNNPTCPVTRDPAPAEPVEHPTYAEVQRIRQRAIFNGTVTRSEVRALAESWLHWYSQYRGVTSADFPRQPGEVQQQLEGGDGDETDL